MSSWMSVTGKLAAALNAGPWEQRQLEMRAMAALGPRSKSRAKRIVASMFATTSTPYAPSRKQLERMLGQSSALDGLSENAIHHLLEFSVRPKPARFSPIKSLRNLDVPTIATPTDLANWLETPLTELEWLSDARHSIRSATSSRLHHYTCVWTPKRSGGWRLLEAPKSHLKSIQRRILKNILEPLPVHPSSFGFVKGRSYIEAAAKHAGEEVVLSVDLSDFFLNTRISRVFATFRCLGYPLKVAQLLTGLCSSATPKSILDDGLARKRIGRMTIQRFSTPHLPQGAPTSPALANQAARHLDFRISGLATRFEAQYTRYADDLTLSGDREFQKKIPQVLKAMGGIMKDEGYSLNPSKTRVMPRNGRQIVTGLVVNNHVNVPRNAYDNLKAILTNCNRLGPASQNLEGHADFRAHLNGRVSWVEGVNLRHGEKLRHLLETINW